MREIIDYEETTSRGSRRRFYRVYIRDTVTGENYEAHMFETGLKELQLEIELVNNYGVPEDKIEEYRRAVLDEYQLQESFND